jgi:hypothetical protein
MIADTPPDLPLEWQAYCRRRKLEQRFDGPVPRQYDAPTGRPAKYIDTRLAARQRGLNALLSGDIPDELTPKKAGHLAISLAVEIGQLKSLRRALLNH